MKKSFFISIVFLAVVFSFFSVFGNNGLVLTDQWERARFNKEIIAEETFPNYNFVYGEKVLNSYPPNFDVLSASSIIFSGLSFIEFEFVLSITLLFLMFFLGFLLARNFFDESFSIIFGVLVVLPTTIFRELLHPLPSTIGYVIILAALWLFFKKKFFYCGLLIALLGLFHFRSFASLTAIITLAVIFNYKKFQFDAKKTAAIYSLPLIVFLGWFFFRANGFALQAISNKWINLHPPIFVFSIIFATGIIGFFLFLLQKKRIDFFSAWLVLALLFYGILFFTIIGYRETVYMFVPLAFFSTCLLEMILKKWKAIGIILIALLTIFLVYGNFSAERDAAYFNGAKLDFYSKLNTIEGKVIVSDHMGSYLIPYYSDNFVIAGAFLEQVPNGSERANDLFGFYEKCKPNEEFFKKYNVSYVIFSEYAQFRMKCNANKFDSEKKFERVFENKAAVLIKIK